MAIPAGYGLIRYAAELLKKLLRALLILAGIAAACSAALLALLFAAVALLDPMSVSESFEIEPQCQFDPEEELRARIPGGFSFDDFVSERVTIVRSVGPYGSAETVRTLGFKYSPKVRWVPEDHYVLMLLDGDSPVCAAVAPSPRGYYWRKSVLDPARGVVYEGDPPEPEPIPVWERELDPTMRDLVGLAPLRRITSP